MAKYVQHLDFMKRLDDAMKNIIHVGQINAYDIPAIVVLCTELLAVKGTVTVNAIHVLYEFIMDHYNLSPASDNDTLKADFQQMFDRCLTLLTMSTTKTQKLHNIWRKLISGCCGRKGAALINTELNDDIVDNVNSLALLPVIDMPLTSVLEPAIAPLSNTAIAITVTEAVSEPVWDNVAKPEPIIGPA